MVRTPERVGPAGRAATVGMVLGVAVTVGATPISAAVESSQACPAGQVPVSAFGDIGGNTHAASIECVVWHRIARGVTATTFEPHLPVRRDQMASFVARTLEAAGVDLDTPGDQGFTDIVGNVHAEAINQIAALGVARGTSATSFEPHLPVRRDQMASFVARTLEVLAIGPPEVTGPVFHIGADVAAEDEWTVREGIAEAAAKMEQLTGYRADDFEVHAHHSADGVAEAHCEFLGWDPSSPLCDPIRDRWEDGVGGGMRGAIFIRTAAFATHHGGGRTVMLHEYVHALQDELSAPVPTDPESADEVPLVGPRWLWEGQAMYFELMMFFGEEFESHRQGQWSIARMDEVRPSLQTLETPRGLNEADDRRLSMMFVAVDVLLRDFDASFADHMAFHQRLGAGAMWEEAFQHTFGITVEDFYTHFDGL